MVITSMRKPWLVRIVPGCSQFPYAARWTPHTLSDESITTSVHYIDNKTELRFIIHKLGILRIYEAAEISTSSLLSYRLGLPYIP